MFQPASARRLSSLKRILLSPVAPSPLLRLPAFARARRFKEFPVDRVKQQINISSAPRRGEKCSFFGSKKRDIARGEQRRGAAR